MSCDKMEDWVIQHYIRKLGEDEKAMHDPSNYIVPFRGPFIAEQELIEILQSYIHLRINRKLPLEDRKKVSRNSIYYLDDAVNKIAEEKGIKLDDMWYIQKLNIIREQIVPELVKRLPLILKKNIESYKEKIN